MRTSTKPRFCTSCVIRTLTQYRLRIGQIYQRLSAERRELEQEPDGERRATQLGHDKGMPTRLKEMMDGRSPYSR